MIVYGYRTFADGYLIASFMKVIVAVITEETSGAGNGTNCSQFNIVISLVEAMYLFEGMWLFLFWQRGAFSISHRRLKAKYTHRTKLRFVLCVFRDCIELNAGNGDGFVNGCLCTHSHEALEGRR